MRERRRTSFIPITVSQFAGDCVATKTYLIGILRLCDVIGLRTKTANP